MEDFCWWRLFVRDGGQNHKCDGFLPHKRDTSAHQRQISTRHRPRGWTYTRWLAKTHGLLLLILTSFLLSCLRPVSRAAINQYWSQGRVVHALHVCGSIFIQDDRSPPRLPVIAAQPGGNKTSRSQIKSMHAAGGGGTDQHVSGLFRKPPVRLPEPIWRQFGSF